MNKGVQHSLYFSFDTHIFSSNNDVEFFQVPQNGTNLTREIHFNSVIAKGCVGSKKLDI